MICSIATLAVAGAAGLVVVAVAAFLLLLAVAAVLGQLSGFPTPSLWLVPLFAGLDVAFTWLVLRGLADVVRRDARFGIRWRRATRLARFADANVLFYVPEVRNPAVAGMIFNAGTRRRATDIIGGDEGIPFELGNYQYAGRSHERSLRRYGFIRIDLPRRLPHMVLISRANRRSFGRSNLPWRIPGTQVLSMGAPFDAHFTLYCPEKYEPDAHYVFTPKLMTLLVDRARDFDVEIVDNGLLLYRARPLLMTDSSTYELLGDLLETIGTGTSARASLYRDPRALRAGRVGPYGRRLEVRAPRMAAVVTVVGVAYLVARILAILVTGSL